MASSISKTLTTLRRAGLSIPRYWSRRTTLPFSSLYSISEEAFSSTTEASSSSTSSAQAQENQRGSWSRWLLYLPGAITFGLGTWQIFRRQDKMEMLDYRTRRLELEPVNVNSIIASSGGDFDSIEFRRVICEGAFDENKSIYVGPRPRSISGVTENGYYVITPLTPIKENSDSVQSPVLVNRGWVPRSWREMQLGELQDGEQPSIMTSIVLEEGGRSWWRFWSKKPKDSKGEASPITSVKVIGVIRGGEKPSIFVPANDPASGQWFYVDVPAIARACGLPENTVYVEEINESINPSKPYPVPKDVNSFIRSPVMPQDHLNYALTWYSLSAAVTFMAFKRLTPNKGTR